jgi:hypothetical protein
MEVKAKAPKTRPDIKETPSPEESESGDDKGNPWGPGRTPSEPDDSDDPPSDTSSSIGINEQARKKKSDSRKREIEIANRKHEAMRKNKIECRKELRSFDPKLWNNSNQVQLRRWVNAIQIAAGIHFGPDWRSDKKMLTALIPFLSEAMSGTMKNTVADAVAKESVSYNTWEGLVAWITGMLPPTLIAEEAHTRSILFDKKCHQITTESVTDFSTASMGSLRKSETYEK